METKPGKCPICRMDLTPISLDQIDSKGIKLSEQQVKLANIQTSIVSYDYVDNKVYATGIVRENENSSAFINARIDGRIDKLYFKSNGAYINKGQIVYAIYSEMLAATQSELINIYKQVQQNPNDLSQQLIMKGIAQKLALWGISARQIEKIKHKTAPQIPFPIESPYSGFIKNIKIGEGNMVMEGQSIFELLDYKTLWVDAQFYPNETLTINTGDQVDVMIEGAGQNYIQGKVVEILPQVNSSSTINIVRILIQPKSDIIKPGMQANVYWHKSNNETLVVPSSAVLRDSQGATVWVKNKVGVYESKMVHIGEVSGKNMEILHGLDEGDEVVISGAYLLQSEFVFKKGLNPMAGHDMKNM